ncbi:hypothetical protein GGF32_001050 [Allomyces javanicus]|nr:hypothetical protein GGF32_001050 [Allomyces javanicus]
MPDESEPDALTEDMKLVEMLLGIFASDRLRILDLDETKAVDADAAWVEQVPRSVHSLTVLVHKLQNKEFADALLEQTPWANVSGRAHKDMEAADYDGIGFRMAFLKYVDPPFGFLGHSEEYDRHKQKYGLIGCGRFGQDGRVNMAIMNETQLITMVE